MTCCDNSGTVLGQTRPVSTEQAAKKKQVTVAMCVGWPETVETDKTDIQDLISYLVQVTQPQDIIFLVDKA